MILVIDASVAIAWIAADEQSPYAYAALASCAADRAVVPALWRWEIANTLVMLERKGRVTDAAAAFASMARNLPIDVAPATSLTRSLEEIALAQRHGLTIYDAAYLAIARGNGLPLATLEAKLARAAEAEGVYYRPG